MAKAIKAPKMGNTVESIILGEIKVKPGDLIKEGDTLFEYETDKSTTDFKSEDSGEVLKILYEAGDEVKVLQPVIIIGKKGDDLSEWEKNIIENINENKNIEEKIIQVEVNENVTSETNKELDTNLSENNNNFNYSPRAKYISKNLGIDITKVKKSSGVNNRIIEKDVLEYYYQDENLDNTNKILKQKEEFNRVAFTPIRKAIARSMEGSIQHGAQLTLMAPFDATALLNVREIIKNKVKNDKKIENSSINDLIVFVLARLLVEFPDVNSIIGSDYYEAYNVAHVSIAVDTPKGLFVPVIKNASEISLNALTKKSKELILKTREGKLTGKDQSGGTFTISNLGLSGVIGFTPILNPPQSALLGVGSPIKRLKMNANGIVQYNEIILSLTMDHRPFDGARGAEFLKALVKKLENILYEEIVKEV
ncbi:MAG: dihydrolipoamide acetyltransferase component of pyruvate dehydrogenase complex [Candidatus Hepatoplasma vulgare]|nr:MAG: dihydrolipoamide acetyltransferase component of pyruvate dehydrogenase complex [Candidatus Hepatoplasma sp.]